MPDNIKFDGGNGIAMDKAYLSTTVNIKKKQFGFRYVVGCCYVKWQLTISKD